MDVQDSTILNNRSDGIGVLNNSYARVVLNTIEGNGRPEVGEAGIQVNRSRVRGGGNVIRNNTGIAALIIVNHSDYRSGTGVNPELPDNEFPFERIEHDTGVHNGQSLLAIDLNQKSYGDFRQVHVVGSVAVGDHSMMQVRGDQFGSSQPPSTVNATGGFLFVSGRFGLLRLRNTQLTGACVNVAGPFGVLDGAACPPPPM